MYPRYYFNIRTYYHNLRYIAFKLKVLMKIWWFFQRKSINFICFLVKDKSTFRPNCLRLKFAVYVQVQNTEHSSKESFCC